MKRLVPSLFAIAFVLHASASAAEPGVWDRIKAFFSGLASSEPAAAAPVAETPAPNPPLDPAAEAARHKAAAEASLKLVTTMYPAVLEKGSVFNEEFCARLRKLQTQNPDAFKKDDWPMELAKATEQGMLKEQYESPEVRRRMSDNSHLVAEVAEEVDLTGQQQRLGLPLALIEPPVAPAVPHINQWSNWDREQFYRENWGNDNWRYSSNYSNNYSGRYYDTRYYNVPMNSYIAGPELTARGQELASKLINQYGGTRRALGASPYASPSEQNWRNRLNSR